MLQLLLQRYLQPRPWSTAERSGGSIHPARRRTLAAEPLEDRRLLTVSYNVTDLGTLGGSVSLAYGVNASGQVVGGSTAADGSPHAFLYTAGTMQDLGVLPGGGTSAAGRSINDSGQVVGVATLANGQVRGFYYSGSGSLQDLGTFPGGSFSAATGINNAGTIVGESQLANGQYEGFVIGSDGTMQDIGNLGGAYSAANGINNNGDIVGMSDTIQHPRAFLLPSGGGPMQDLGTFPNGTFGGATAINASGQIVGQSDAHKGELTAFLYSGGQMQDLGTLPGGTGSYANAINSAGVVVGQSSVASGAVHAFIYTGGTMVDLNSLIDPASGWLLEAANGINDAGQIVGTGMNPQGQTEAFILNPAGASAPQVASVVVAGSDWSSGFLGGLRSAGQGDGSGYTVPLNDSAQGATLPWVNLNQIKIAFNDNVNVQAGSLSVTGVSGATYSFANFSFDTATHTATWTLNAPIGADRLSLDLHSSGQFAVTSYAGVPLNGAVPGAGTSSPSVATGAADFSLPINVLPGDMNGQGEINGLDISYIASHWLQRDGVAGDVNGDGVVNGLDSSAIGGHWLQTLPPANGAATITSSAAASVVAAPATLGAVSTIAASAASTIAPVVSIGSTSVAASGGDRVAAFVGRLTPATIDQAFAQIENTVSEVAGAGANLGSRLRGIANTIAQSLPDKKTALALESAIAQVDDRLLAILANRR